MTKKMLALLKSNFLILALAMAVAACPLFCVVPVRADDTHHEACHKTTPNKSPEVKYCCNSNGVLKSYDSITPEIIVEFVAILSLVPEIDLADSQPTCMQTSSSRLCSQASQILRI